MKFRTLLIPILFGLFSIKSFAQNSVNAKGIFSGNTQDSTSIKNTLSSLQALYGNYGGLYFNNLTNKWRIWVGTCVACAQDSTWIDLPLGASGGGGLAGADNGLSVVSDSVQLGGRLHKKTTIVLTDSLIFSSDIKINGVIAGRGKSSVFNNTAFGHFVLSNATTGHGNTMFGEQSGKAITTGSFNTGFGVGNLERVVSADGNTAMGYHSQEFNVSGASNTSVGQQSLFNLVSGIQNTGIGFGALSSVTTGNNNTAVGEGALGSVSNQTFNTAVGESSGLSSNGPNNSFFGAFAGQSVSTGGHNTLLGASSSSNISSGNYNVSIGDNTAVPSATSDGQLSIQNAIYGTGNLALTSVISTGSIGFYQKTLSSQVHLPYGHAGAGRSGLKLPASANLLASPESGSIENDGTHIYWTDSLTSTRHQLDQQGGGSVAGSNTQIQFNNAGSFGADSRFVYFSATNQQELNSANGNTISLVGAAGSAGGESIQIGHTNNTVTLSTVGIAEVGTNAPNFEISSITATGNAGRITYNTDISHIFSSRLSNTVVIIQNIPTSSAGLPSGSLYSVAGVINIVP